MSRKMVSVVKRIGFFTLLVFCSVLFSVNTYANTAGGDGGGASNCSDCTTVYTAARGGWVQIPMVKDVYKMSDVLSYINASRGTSWSYNQNYGDTITGCNTISEDNTVWILVATFRTNGTPVGLAGSLKLNKVSELRGGMSFGAPGDIGDSSYARTSAEAEAAFNKYKAEHNANGRYYTSGSGLGWFCGGGEAGNPPAEEAPKVCNDASGYFASSYLGNTAGRVSVANLTNTKNWSDGNNTNKSASTGFNASGDSVSIFAKPGDSIRFRHNLCYGARAIRDSNGAHVSPGGNYHAPSIPANYFKISASPNDNYLLTKSMSKGAGLFGRDINITDMKSMPQQVAGYSESNAVTIGQYGFEAYTPGGSKPQDKYSCSYFKASANGPSYQSNGYQIPGFKSGVGNCNSRTNTENNNAGKVISQSLTFDNVRAWQKYTTSNGGSCHSCDSDGAEDAYDDLHTHNSFDSAKGVSASGGLVWGLYHFPECVRVTPGGAKDCHETCDEWNYDRYGNRTTCKSSSYKNYKWKQPAGDTLGGIYGSTRTAYYEVLKENAGRVTKTASVYIPYNFNTEVKVTNPTSGTTVYQGEPINTKFSWKITKRSNSEVSSSAYATTTPSSAKYQIVEFITNTSPSDGRLAANDDITISSPLDYYRQITYGGHISVIRAGSDHTNENGNYNGDSATHSNNGIIPDNEDLVGYKYCVAIGIYPASSHAKGDNNNKGGAAFSENGNGKWNLSGATCRTIAKKPSFQVWGGSIYTGGNVDTAVAKKISGAKLGDKSDGKSPTLYGSWVEYAALVGGNVGGLGTGASLGYNLNTFAFNYRGGHANTSNMLDLSYMTVQNMTNKPGRSRINATTPNNAWLAQLYARYRDAAKKFGDGGNTDNGNHIYTMDSGMQVLHVKTNGTYNLSQLFGLNPGDSGKKNSDTIHVSNKTLAKSAASGFDTDNTLVIYVENGTINIDKNICYSNSTAECDFTAAPKDNSNLALQLDTSSLSVDALEKLPQVLIFAKNIKVDARVNRIDAWLIADGDINTCTAGHGNSATCDTALVVNGPLYARTVNFNRTAGAHGGVNDCTSAVCNNNEPRSRNIGGVDDGSIAPAEVFNLRADVYLWAQNQAARYVQAVSTFTRELAPRY